MATHTIHTKSAYQIKREKAGTRGGWLITLLLVLILASNADSVFAAEDHKVFKLASVGYDLGHLKESLDDVRDVDVTYKSFDTNKLDLQAIAGSDVIVMDGINDLSGFFDLVNQMPEAIIVVVGDSLIGQGLMLDNLIVTHAFVADDTVMAILRMKIINPQLRQAQLLHGLFGENEFDQLALQQEDVKPINIDRAVKYAQASLAQDVEAPRGFIANSGYNRVVAKVEDNRSVSYVEMYVDNQFVSRDYEAPFEFKIEDPNKTTFIAYDSAANHSQLSYK